MSERSGLWSPLASSFVYEAFQHLIGGRRWLKAFAQDVIEARPGERLLDIGCGPGTLLRHLPEGVAYVGFDRNPSYIDWARRRSRGRGEFICDDVANFVKYDLPPADIAVAIGLIHHLDDELAAGLVREAASALRPGGRLITVDPCYYPGQSSLERFVVSRDRGMHVRPLESYKALCGSLFAEPTVAFKGGHLLIPYGLHHAGGAGLAAPSFFSGSTGGPPGAYNALQYGPRDLA